MIKNGTTYPDSTPMSLVRALEHHRNMQRGPGSRVRVKFTWGTSEGYIGRTVGDVRAPLLIHNRRSMGGELLDVEKIVEVRSTLKPCRKIWSLEE